jgi:CubicO group peptidase (beta-lactamase class C family)
MRRVAPVLALVSTLLALAPLAPPALAQTGEGYDYHRPTDRLVTRGMHALMLCNGLFVSERPIDLVHEQELALYAAAVTPPGEVAIDRERRTVAVGVGGNDSVPVMRAAYREGLGCMVLAPDQDFDDLDELPRLEMAPLPGAPETIPWPDGDLVEEGPLPEGVDRAALEAAGEWAFDRATHGHPSQITLSLLVVHRGRIVYERYAPGVDRTTRTRTWSTAKSIAVTLIGIAVGEGLLDLDAPLPFTSWGTGRGGYLASTPDDPRRQITLRHVLHMSSGLYPVDNRLCHVVGSCLSYWAGTSSVDGALDRGLVAPPGTVWDYENYDTLLALHALELALAADGGGRQEYLEYPRRALFDRIGMRSTLPGTDRFGRYVMSSQVYTNARDLARLGLLYLNEGRWGGEQVLPAEWVDFVRRPAPATEERGRFYGGQWWLPPDGRDDVPPDAYSTAGNRGQYAVVVPSQELVVVRRGLDWLPGEHGFSQWDLTREVLKAYPERPWGEKAGSGGEVLAGR